MKKNNVSKMVEKIKETKKKMDTQKVPGDMAKNLTEAIVHPAFRERDMRKEAMDMGSHGATEMWGGSGDGGI